MPSSTNATRRPAAVAACSPAIACSSVAVNMLTTKTGVAPVALHPRAKSASGYGRRGMLAYHATAVFVQLIVLETLLTMGIVVLYGSEVDDPLLLVLTAAAAAVAVATTGTLYGALASGLGARETLLPILLLPVLAPVLIGATRSFDDALGAAAVDGWAWLGLLVIKKTLKRKGE